MTFLFHLEEMPVIKHKRQSDKHKTTKTDPWKKSPVCLLGSSHLSWLRIGWNRSVTDMKYWETEERTRIGVARKITDLPRHMVGYQGIDCHCGGEGGCLGYSGHDGINGRLGSMQGLTWTTGITPEDRRKIQARTYDTRRQGESGGSEVSFPPISSLHNYLFLSFRHKTIRQRNYKY